MSLVCDVAVAGGGAIGMASAWRLAQAGLNVAVFERDRLGAEASSAAAGMLGAQLEVHEPGPFYQLCVESRERYPAFAEELLAETGIDIQYVRSGILKVAPAPDQAAALQAQAAWQRAAGSRAEWLSAAEVAHLEPAASAGCGGLWLPEDGHVQAPLLVQALARAVHQTCQVFCGEPVLAVRCMGDSVLLQTPARTVAAGALVVAAGAWAGTLLPQLGVSFPVVPVKGQLMAVRPRGALRLQRVLHSGEVYLVPKRDGTVVVGATEEHDAGFQRDVTAAGLAWLLDAYCRAVPGLADAAVERTWTGFRPGSPLGQPVLGALPDVPVHLAVGHFRNGILLTPITAELVCRSVTSQPWPVQWQAFLPQARGALAGQSRATPATAAASAAHLSERR